MKKTLIERIEVGSGGAASITFSSIPTDGTYTDLYLIFSMDSNRSPGVGESVKVQFNGSAANFTGRYLYSYGSGNVSGTATNLLAGSITGNATANTMGNSSLYIPNFASSNYKSFSLDASAENNATEAYLVTQAGLWSNTAAITSINLAPDSGTLLTEYSSASLYGITAGNDGITTVS